MKKIIITTEFNDDCKKLVSEKSMGAELIFIKASELKAEDVRDIDAFVGAIPRKFIPEAARLEYLQLNSAGADAYIAPGVLPEHVTLCNATGAYGPAVAEHLFAGILMAVKRLHLYRDNQSRHEWQARGYVRPVSALTTLVIGPGDIGGRVAAMLKALGSYIICVRRTISEKPDFADEVYTSDKLNELLPRADVIAMAVPGSAATYRLINAESFALMKDGVIIANAGRGTAIDTDALCDALDNGRVAAAFLDVTDPEPLPPNHPLWAKEGAIITPHISGGYNMVETQLRLAGIIGDNLRRYINGEPLDNIVDRSTGYKKR